MSRFAIWSHLQDFQRAYRFESSNWCFGIIDLTRNVRRFDSMDNFSDYTFENKLKVRKGVNHNRLKWKYDAF